MSIDSTTFFSLASLAIFVTFVSRFSASEQNTTKLPILQSAFFATLVENLRRIPGVQAAGAVTTLPMNPVGIDYDIEMVRNLKSMFFGGEGMFLATLRGTGTVLLQSLPFSRLADRILANAPSRGGRSADEGSILGRLGRLVDGS